MNNDVNETNPEVKEGDDFTETAVLPEPGPTDNVGDVSVEINVEQLIADIESEKDSKTSTELGVRRKLEEIAEQKSIEDTYAFEMDAD